MKTSQFTLTVNEGKNLIAQATISDDSFKHSLKNGKVILKGGTTVSIISEILAERPLRICGRNTKKGTTAFYKNDTEPHTLMFEDGEWFNIDSDLKEKLSSLGSDDTLVIGANALDINGDVAMMAGSVGGGEIGRNLPIVFTTSCNVIVTTGLEKLIPTKISDCIKTAHNNDVIYATGMSVGLFPIYGNVITEIEAFKKLFNIEATVIGAGGIFGGEGSYTFVCKGEPNDLERAYKYIKILKESDDRVSGTSTSLVECIYPCESCARHSCCGYKEKYYKETVKKVATITIGQSPREDITGDINDLLEKHIRLIEYGVLDGYTLEQVNDLFAAKEGYPRLVTRMKDGTQVIVDEGLVYEKMQECIKRIEKKVDAIVLLCTGDFSKLTSTIPLITPKPYINSLVNTFSKNKKIGVLIPDESQQLQVTKWWNDVGIEIESIAISPYLEVESLSEKIAVLKDRLDIDCVVLDCMGYSKKMKEVVSKATNNTTILPRTFIARIVNELI